MPAMDATSTAFSVVTWTVILLGMGSAVLLIVAFLPGLPAPTDAEVIADT